MIALYGITNVPYSQSVFSHFSGSGAKSATVVEPLGWLCDALATALMVTGEDGAKYFAQPELAGYQVFVVDRHENTPRSI